MHINRNNQSTFISIILSQVHCHDSLGHPLLKQATEHATWNASMQIIDDQHEYMRKH